VRNQEPFINPVNSNEKIPRIFTEKTLRELIELLQSDDENTSYQAAYEIINRGSAQADHLIYSYYYEDNPYDWRIIQVIGQRGTEKHLGFLYNVMKKSDGINARYAKEAVSLIKSRRR